ncbi:MAG: TIGR03557 family F420-dependent LLM class oxidoreductase [Pseudomonadota bacterium]
MKFAWLCSHETHHPEVLVDQAVHAEAQGFDMVLGSDHFHPWVDDRAAAGSVWTWLGAVAARTERVELATSVTCPLFRYHPALIAQAAATVDRLAPGRFVLGVGTGENINEGPLGFEFPNYQGRTARMKEALEIIRRLCGGEKLDFAGDHYTVEKAKLYSPPTRPIPLWMAAGGPTSAQIAATHADGLITSVRSPADTRDNIVLPYRAAAQEGGYVMATRWAILADNADVAWEAVASLRGLRAPGRLEAIDPMTLRERADALGRDEILSHYTVATTVEDLIEIYRPLVEMGVDCVSIQIASVHPERTLSIVGTEVLPALRALAA